MISVIVPVYNDPEGLEETLESLVSQETECQYEIIPVDNNSTDKTSEVIEEFQEKYPEKVRGCEETKIQSSYAARNTGLKESKGDIICFLDSDMWVEVEYLSKVYSFFTENPDIEYIGCNVEIVREDATAASLYDKINGFPVNEYLEEKDFAPTCCLSVRRSIFEEIGYFNENLISGGDKVFGKKARREGIGIQYVGNITAYHPARSNWKEIKNKYFRIGRGWYQKQLLGTEEAIKDKLGWHDIKSIFLFNPMKLGKNTDHDLNLKRRLRLFIIKIVKKISIFAGYQYEKLIRN